MKPPHWLQELLLDSETTDICLNGTERAYRDRGCGMEEVQSGGWDELELKSWVLEELSAAGKTWDARQPFVDAALRTGHRLHVIFPPVARPGILVSLRRLPNMNRVQDQKPSRWVASRYYEILKQAVERGDSILIAGATGSGKTTLACDLLGHVPVTERIIALEDTPELAPHHPHFLSLLSRPPNADGCGEVTLRSLLKQTLRMRPDRIVLGECRGAEVLDLLQAINTGHHGSMATLHANSPREALRRLELLCLLSAGAALPLAAIRELLALGIQWVAQVRKENGQRLISELWRVEGREGDTILMRPMVQI